MEERCETATLRIILASKALRASGQARATLRQSRALWGGGAFLDLFGEGLNLIVGDLDIAAEKNEEAAGAGVLELGIFDCGVTLHGGRESGAQVGAFLHGVEDGLVNFFLEHLAESAGAKKLAERAIGLNLADGGDKAKLGAIFLDGGGERHGNDGIAGNEPFRLLLAENFGAAPAFVVKLDDGESGVCGGSERGVLNGDAVTATVVFIELGAEQVGHVQLETGEIGGEIEREDVETLGLLAKDDVGGGNDGNVVVFDL